MFTAHIITGRPSASSQYTWDSRPYVPECDWSSSCTRSSNSSSGRGSPEVE